MNIENGREDDLHSMPKIVYHPEYKETQMVRFTKFVEERYKIKLNDFWELQEWSCQYYPEFWECVWIFFDVLYSQPYSEVYNKKNTFRNMEWFKDACLNYAANVLKYRDSHTAIIAADNKENVQRVSYDELYDEVRIYADALKDSGVGKGDVVACYMKNKVEAVFAFLATASLGAIWTGTLPLLGTKAVLSRFQQVSPKILFTAGNFFFEGKEIKMDEKIPNVVLGLPSLVKVVFAPSNSNEKMEDISEIPKCIYVKEFLEKSRRKLQDEATELMFEQVPFDYPLCISYTSGTTGNPKGLIHSHGMFFASLKDFGLQQDCTRKDVLFNFSPNGWISWGMLVNTLHLGLTVVMYDGYPFDESPTRFWDLVDQFGITSFYIWSSTLADMTRDGNVPTSKHSLKSLKQMFPNGSPAKPHTFDFITEKVKKNLFCTATYGATEFFGLISGLDSNLPIYRGEIQAPSLGTDIRILDETGNSVVGKIGEVVLDNPYPACPVKLLNDENKEMMTELYLTEHPGYWNVGDHALINPKTKGMIVYGRSDETMNPKGARFSCSEIYFALEDFPGIMDSVCVSQYNSDLDERVVLFVKMLPGHSLTDAVANEIKRTIADQLTIEHVPDIVMEVQDIPYNLTGKKLNGLVKKLINRRKVMNTEVVVNPSSLDFFRRVDLGEF